MLHCMLPVGLESLDDLDVNLGHKLAHSDLALSLAYLFGDSHTYGWLNNDIRL